MKTIITTVLLLGLWTSQGTFEANTEKSEFIVKGTSTVHDWESVINDYKVTGVITENLVTDLKVVVQSKSIKSGKGIMDDKTYDALEANDFPTIEFTAEELSRTGDKIVGTGTLKLVGKTKEFTINATATKNADGTTQVAGTVPITMSEFGIEPPTAMFGTLTTGDDVTIEFNFVLN